VLLRTDRSSFKLEGLEEEGEGGVENGRREEGVDLKKIY
jgi:hypothetical protein